MNETAGNRQYTMLTGATGFLGHVLAAELLRRNHDCVVLCRGPAESSKATLGGLLRDFGLDARGLIQAGRLVIMEGQLPDDLPALPPVAISRVVHAAASTRFDSGPSGDPGRTNNLGTAALLEWAGRVGIGELHLISTAFACGKTSGPVPERVMLEASVFRNVYERSKWQAECHAIRWAREHGRSCTIYRPSIIVGDFATGRASRFSGLYPALRAFDRCVHASASGHSACAGRRLAMRIESCESGRMNIVPVDHVAALIVKAIERPELHGVVYNLVDPAPFTNSWLLSAIEQYYSVTGASVGGIGGTPAAELNDAERRMASALRAMRGYFIEAPSFERRNTSVLEAAAGCSWPKWDSAAVHRLIEFALRANWGRGMNKAEAVRTSDPIIVYFERFFPERIAVSGLTGMRELDATFQFIVEGDAESRWTCRFKEGRFLGVRVGASDEPADFAYRMNRAAFLDIVGARVDPQDVFLEGRAEVSGDVEKALKMGMILQQFTREHPFHSEGVVAGVRGACNA